MSQTVIRKSRMQGWPERVPGVIMIRESKLSTAESSQVIIAWIARFAKGGNKLATQRGALPARFRDEDHLRGIVAEGRTIEIAVLRGEAEAAARQQMLDFIAEEIP